LLYGGDRMVKAVNIHQPYVYLDYLQSNYPATWDAAVAAVESINSSFNSTSAQERIQNAITFLNTFVATQRENEIKFINAKIQELNSYEINDPKFNKIRNKMELIIKNAQNGFDYQQFSSLLNEILSVEEDYKARLEFLLQSTKTEGKKEKQQRGLLVGIQREFSDTLKFLTGEKNKIRETTKDYAKIMPQVIYNYVKNHQKDLNFNSPTELAGGLLKIQLNFRQWLEKNKKLRNPEGDTLKERIENLEKEFESFMKIDEQTTRLSILTSDEAKKFAKIFNFSSPTKTENKHIDFFINPQILTEIQDINSPPTVVFTSDITSNRLAEITSLAFEKFDFGKGTGAINMGNDAILGHISASYELGDNSAVKSSLENFIDDLAQITKDFADERKDRDNYLAYNALMNYEITERFKKLDNDLSNIKNESQNFIIHETTKYYETIEKGSKKGAKGKEIEGFSGRSLSILNYIDVMRNIDLDFGIDPDSWYFSALNLGEHSPANGMRDQLSKIFSIAASLIMFDDATIMVQEAVGELTFSNISNLHLYNLQGLYFPASYIIQETANYLMGLSDTTNAATVSISIPKNAYKDYANHYGQKEKSQKMKDFLKLSSDERWEKMKAVMASQTKVSIHFFLNFQNFIAGMKTIG